MREIYIYCCLLPAFSIVEMNPLSKNGNVGENVTFTCSNWKGWGDPQERVKYLCKDPCNNKDVIMEVKSGQTKIKDRIQLKNTGGSLVVTFFNLQKSDAKKYYCGMERPVWDLFIELNLKVTQGPRPKPTPVITKFSPSPAVLSSSTMSSNDSETTPEESTSSTNSSSTISPVSATHESGGLPYFIAVVTVMVSLLLMAALVLYRIIAKKPPKIISSARDPREDSVEANTENEDNRGENEVGGQVECVANTGVDPNIDLYANAPFLQDIGIYTMVQPVLGNPVDPAEQCLGSSARDPQSDLVYSVVEFPQTQLELASRSESNHPQNNQNDSFYSLAQL